jgi:hypothetical protein
MYYILARMVLNMRGTLRYDQPWDVQVDLFFHRDPEELDDEAEEVRRLTRLLSFCCSTCSLLAVALYTIILHACSPQQLPLRCHDCLLRM